MVNGSSNWENLSIYCTNLSPVYLCCSVLTALTLFCTWWYTNRGFGTHEANPSNMEGLIQQKHSRMKSLQNFSEDTKNEVEDDGSWDSQTETILATSLPRDQSMMKHIKSARQTAMEKQLTAGLSVEQLEKEREIQASQLAAIYKLLKEKEDQFQIRSMDELQEQLRLYKDL